MQDNSKQNAVPEQDKTSAENQTIATMHSDISDLHATIKTLKIQLQEVNKMALSTHPKPLKNVFLEMNDQIYQKKKKNAHLKDYHVDHTTLAACIPRVDTVRTKTWATKADLRLKEEELEKSMLAKIKAKLKDSWKTTNTNSKCFNHVLPMNCMISMTLPSNVKRLLMSQTLLKKLYVMNSVKKVGRTPWTSSMMI